LGIALVALESTEYFGADRTTHPLRWLAQLLFGPLNDNTWNLIHLYIRESGHFLGYGALGLVWLRAWWMSLPGSRFLVDSLLGLAGTALVASWDEWHQTFLPNRTGTPGDVLLDCCGALAMQLIIYVLMRIFRPKQLVHGN
jgi:VanZ family protein